MSKETKMRVIRHASATLQSLNKCRKEGLLCDVTIIVGEETYLAHRYVLAVSSEYFRNLFSEDKKEEVIRINDAKPEIIKQCIDFIYTGITDITDDNIRPLWKACSDLQLVDISDRCAEYLFSGMNTERCLLARELAIQHGHVELQKVAEKFARDNFDIVSMHSGFLKLAKEDVVYFLSATKNALYPPPIMYNAVINWIYQDFESRTCHFPKLLRYIKLSILPSSFLVETVKREPLFRKFQESRSELEAELFSRLYKTKVNSAIILFDSGATVKAYNVETRKQCRMQGLDQDFLVNCTALAVWDYLYILKGDLTFRLNRRNRVAKWVKMNKLSISRTSKIKCAAVDDSVYVTGGRIGPDGKVTAVGEFLDPKDEKWTNIRDMLTPRDGHTMISDGSYIYCIGGITEDGVVLDSVEKFEINTGTWSVVMGRMKTARTEAAGLEWDGNMYVFGGKTSSGEVTNTVEFYKSESSVWTMVTKMLRCRCDFSVGKIGDAFFVVGGEERDQLNSQKQVHKQTIETFDLKSRKWEVYDTVSISGKLEAAVVTCI